MYKSLLSTLSLLALGSVAFAQTEVDALRYSQLSPLGTALSMGMGGVGGSMGGDFTGLSINPAGIGIYRRSEVSLTVGMVSNAAKSTLAGNETQDQRLRPALTSAGFVTHRKGRGRWNNYSFAIGYNQMANYSMRTKAIGDNYASSISDVMSIDAQNYGTSEQIAPPPYGFLGFQGYLIDNNLNPIVPLTQGLLQQKSIEAKGASGELTLSLGGNYDNQWLVGATIGIPTYNYSRTTDFLEQDKTNNPNNNFDYALLTETQATQGLGINAKLGVIYKPNDFVNFGVAVHTPSFVAFTDVYDYRIETNTEQYKANAGFTDIDPISIGVPSSSYEVDYGLRTPWSAVLSATANIANRGMLSADYQVVDYKSMKFLGADRAAFEAVNQNIRDQYQLGHVLRVGAEARLGRYFARAGAAYFSSPLRDAGDLGGARTDFSLGLGARFNSFFLDLGYRYSASKTQSQLYDLNGGGLANPQIDARNMGNQVALTLGFKMR